MPISNMGTQETDFSIFFEIDLPWETFITQGQTVISLLRHLMTISGKADFSLIKNHPSKTLQYIRKPNSFRQTLIQVHDDVRGAFENARKHMRTIHLYMQQFRSFIEHALKSLQDASPDVVEHLLPIDLVDIQNIGNSCVNLSIDIATKFNSATLLLCEILDCVELSIGNNEENNLVARILRNDSVELKQSLSSMEENLKQQQSEINAQMKKYQDSVYKALREIPTMWKDIAQDTFRSMVSMLNIITIGNDRLSVQSDVDKQNMTGKLLVTTLLGMMSQLSRRIDMIKGEVELYSNESGCMQDLSGMFLAFSVGFEAIETVMNSTNLLSGETSMKVVQKAKRFCLQLQNLCKKMLDSNTTEDIKTSLINEIESLYETTQPAVAACAYLSNGISLQSIHKSIPPTMFSGSIQNKLFKAHITLELLRNAQLLSDNVFFDMLNCQENTTNLMKRMNILPFLHINFKNITEPIKESIISFGKIQKLWIKVIQIFSMISVHVEVTLNQTVKSFTFNKMSEKTENKTGMNTSNNMDQQLLVEVLQKHVLDIKKIGYFLCNFSDTFSLYNNLTDTQLGRFKIGLLDLDASQREALLQEFNTMHEDGQKKIRRISGETRLSRKRMLQQRIDVVNFHVHQLNGPTRKEENAVRKGFEAMKATEHSDPFQFDLWIRCFLIKIIILGSIFVFKPSV